VAGCELKSTRFPTAPRSGKVRSKFMNRQVGFGMDATTLPPAEITSMLEWRHRIVRQNALNPELPRRRIHPQLGDTSLLAPDRSGARARRTIHGSTADSSLRMF